MKNDKAAALRRAVHEAGLTVAHLVASEIVEEWLLMEADLPDGVTVADKVAEDLTKYPADVLAAYKDLYGAEGR